VNSRRRSSFSSQAPICRRGATLRVSLAHIPGDARSD
jgi:hypothetical protein